MSSICSYRNKNLPNAIIYTMIDTDITLHPIALKLILVVSVRRARTEFVQLQHSSCTTALPARQRIAAGQRPLEVLCHVARVCVCKLTVSARLYS
jgi:hypothetical protein